MFRLCGCFGVSRAQPIIFSNLHVRRIAYSQVSRQLIVIYLPSHTSKEPWGGEAGSGLELSPDSDESPGMSSSKQWEISAEKDQPLWGKAIKWLSWLWKCKWWEIGDIYPTISCSCTATTGMEWVRGEGNRMSMERYGTKLQTHRKS